MIPATWVPIYGGRSLSIAECETLGDWSGREYPLHSHPELQITILADTSCAKVACSTGSGQRHRRRVSGGEICVTPSHQPHTMNWDEASGTVIMCVDPHFVDGALECAPLAVPKIRERYGRLDPFVQRLANLLRRCNNGCQPVSRLKAESIALVMVAHLSRLEGIAGFELAQEVAPIGCGRLAQVVEYIEGNLHKQLSVLDLARIAQMSGFHFVRQFKAATGLTPHQYVMRRRIDRAMQRLHDPRISIADVAFGCGFATQAHMTSVFRKLVGSTPKAYRGAIIS